MKTFALLLLLGVCGCATDATTTAGPQACQVQKVAEVPLSLERGFIIAPAVINDRPVTLVIDTGASRSLVTPHAMSTLRIDADSRNRTTIQGTGGTVTTNNARLQSLGIGGLVMMDQSTAVGTLPVVAGADMRASGLLGADWLSDFDVDFDLPHGRLALYRVQGCSGDYPPFDGPKATVRAEPDSHGLLVLQVKLDGHPLAALLDSGAVVSVVTEAAAAAAGFSTANLPLKGAGRGMGSDGAVLFTHQHRFGRLEVGTTQTANPQLNVAPLQLRTAQMLLGADWFRVNRVWISRASHRVTIQPIGT